MVAVTVIFNVAVVVSNASKVTIIMKKMIVVVIPCWPG